MNEPGNIKVRISFDPQEYFGKFAIKGQQITMEGYLMFIRKMDNGEELYFVDCEKENGTRAMFGIEEKYVTILGE